MNFRRRFQRAVSTSLYVTDDRGVEREVLHRGSHEDADEQTRYALNLAKESEVASSSRYSLPRPAKIVFAVLILAVIGLVVGACSGMIENVMWFQALLVAIILFAFVIKFILPKFQWNDRRYADILLSNGVCPVCAYRVDGLRPAEDGAVECSECGAAWSHERIKARTDPNQPTQSEALLPAGMMSRFRPSSRRRITDGVSAKRFLLDGDFGRAIRVASEDEHRQRLVGVRRRLRQAGALRRILGFFLSIAALLVLVGWLSLVMWGLAISGLSATAGEWLVTTIFFVCIALCCIMTLIGMNWHGHSAPKRKTIRVMLQHGLCPACGEDLKDINPDDEGLTRCPRCVARWRISEAVS